MISVCLTELKRAHSENAAAAPPLASKHKSPFKFLGEANVNEIDELNILHATMLAMQRAVTPSQVPHQVMVDGNRCPDFAFLRRQSSWRRSAPKAISVLIIAKVERDGSRPDTAQHTHNMVLSATAWLPHRCNTGTLIKFGANGTIVVACLQNCKN
jgi:hypothetical protein